MCENGQKFDMEPEPWKKRTPEPETLMKIESSGAGAGAMFMKRRAPGSELNYFYDGSAVLFSESCRKGVSC